MSVTEGATTPSAWTPCNETCKRNKQQTSRNSSSDIVGSVTDKDGCGGIDFLQSQQHRLGTRLARCLTHAHELLEDVVDLVLQIENEHQYKEGPEQENEQHRLLDGQLQSQP